MRSFAEVAQRSYQKNKGLYWIFIAFVIASFIYQCLLLSDYSQYIYDLGMWNRHFWSLIHFNFGPNPLKGYNLLGDHASFLLILLAPFYALYQHLQFFFLVQSIAIGASIFPLWRIANKYFTRGQAYLWIIVYLFFFGFWGAFTYAFHEVVIAVPLLAWMLYFYLEERWRPMLVSAGLLLLVREDMPFYIIGLAVCLFLFKKKRAMALWMVIVSYVYYLLMVKYFMPHIDGFAYYQNQSPLGNSIGAIVKNSLEHPKLFIKTLFSPNIKIEMLIGLFASFGFLSLLSLQGLILIALPLATRLLSAQSFTWGFSEHYAASQGPILFVGAILGSVTLRRIIVSLRPHLKVELVKQAIVVSLVAFAVIAEVVAQNHYTTFARLDDFNFYHRTPVIGSSNQALRLIPKNVSVAASSSFPQLTGRRDIYLWPGPTANTLKIPLSLNAVKPEYIIASLELDDAYMPQTKTQLADIINQEINSGYKMMFNQNGAVVLKRLK